MSGAARAIEWARTTPREQVVARYTSILEKRGRNENTELAQCTRRASAS